MLNLMRGRRFVRTLLLVGLLLLTVPTLVACGSAAGNDDNAPLVQGATRIDSGNVRGSDIDELGYKVADARTGVWTSGQGFDAVADFYQNGIKNDGWNVELAAPYGDEDMFVFLTRDKTLAIVDVMSGASAKSQMDLFTSSNLNFKDSSAGDDDAVILITHFTCAESDVQVCLQGAEGQ